MNKCYKIAVQDFNPNMLLYYFFSSLRKIKFLVVSYYLI